MLYFGVSSVYIMMLPREAQCAVCQQFVALCRDINLLDSKLVAIDGGRLKAVNAKAKNYTRGKMRQKLSEIDTAIERYIGELD